MAMSRNALIGVHARRGKKSEMVRILDEFIARASSPELERVLRECRDQVLAEVVKEGEKAINVVVRNALVGDPKISIYLLDVEGNGGRWKITCGSREQLGGVLDGMKALCRMFEIYMPDPEIP
ncbi:MAG: hypothetical protein HY420_03585 [Candidatus Kerfeldbacteria bacterium]|nr:hypothetical protein [Candidatus Kerfeldbacteria bacterium]